MIRCSECKKCIISETKYQDWLALMNYFEHEFEEGEITQATYENMTDRLMSFKGFVFDADDDEFAHKIANKLFDDDKKRNKAVGIIREVLNGN